MKTSRNMFSILASAALLAGASQLFADGAANVLPSSAQPSGYSLSQLAQDTAVYNTGVFSGSPSTPVPPSIPFTVLENDSTVGQGQYLYLPVFFADNSPPVDPAFPASISNQATDAAYLDNLVSSSYGVSQFFASVDGQIQPLDDSYVTGVTTTQPLLDGTPGGNNYISIAAAISPLSLGQHTVGFGGYIGGSPVTFGADNITVTPEPAAITCLLGAGLVFARRRRS
ncbi:MAG TPA: hypothetical protein VGG19_17880 [Tepidisphaeraceae bacterium]|jgi:hypothetical protein